MSQITRTYTFTDGTTAYGSQVESEISNIVTVWNNHDSASSSWTSLAVTGNGTIGGTLAVTGAVTMSSTLAVTGNATMSGTLSVTGNVGINCSPSTSLDIESTTTNVVVTLKNQTTASTIDIDFQSEHGGVPQRWIIGSNVSNSDGSFEFRNQTTGANILELAAGLVRFPTGSAAAPSVVFMAHTTTGLFDSSGDVQMSIGGVAKYGWSASTFYPVTNGGVDLGTSGLRYGNAYVQTLTLTNVLATTSGGTGVSTKVITTGTYTGNGGAGHTVAHGLGATPDFIIISVTGSGNNIAELYITGMSANSHDFNGTNQTNAITAVDSTNITLGANAAVNQNAVAYAFIAIKAQ